MVTPGPDVISTRCGTQLPQKDSADGGLPIITPAAPRQSLLLAKDPTSFSELLRYPSVRAQTRLPSFLETSLDKVKGYSIRVKPGFMPHKPT